MKQYKCSSDIGSVLIGNRDWTFAVPNMGGDGTTTVRIYDSNREFYSDPWRKGLEFIASVQGTFSIFKYDCDYQKLLAGQMTEQDAHCTLHGRYSIYNGWYEIAFVKRPD